MAQAHIDVSRKGDWNGKVAFQPKQLEVLRRLARKEKPIKIFVGSMTDFGYVEQIGGYNDVLHDIWTAMSMSPQNPKIILTKRPLAVRSWIKREMERDEITDPPPWLWLLVSVWDQDSAESLVPSLLETPAAVHGVSAEPLLGPIDFEHIGDALFDRDAAISSFMGSLDLDLDQADSMIAYPEIDWLIVGGENGPVARKMPAKAARSLRDQAVRAGVPFFFKGWGSVTNKEWGLRSKSPESRTMDGRLWEQSPTR